MHIHRYEKIWLYFGIGSLILFLFIIGYSAFAMGHHPPSHISHLDPKKVRETPPFDTPGLRQLDETTYEAVILAMTFGYEPNHIEIPVGSTVLFKVTSPDVVHSFTIPLTNVNMMVTPGHVNVASHTFREAGTYLILCNEYCGVGHHLMQMKIEVIE